MCQVDSHNSLHPPPPTTHQDGANGVQRIRAVGPKLESRVLHHARYVIQHRFVPSSGAGFAQKLAYARHGPGLVRRRLVKTHAGTCPAGSARERDAPTATHSATLKYAIDPNAGRRYSMRIWCTVSGGLGYPCSTSSIGHGFAMPEPGIPMRSRTGLAPQLGYSRHGKITCRACSETGNTCG